MKDPDSAKRRRNEATSERFFVVYSNGSPGTKGGETFTTCAAKTPKQAASLAFQTDQFSQDTEVFVFDTKRSVRFVRAFTAVRGV